MHEIILACCGMVVLLYAALLFAISVGERRSKREVPPHAVKGKMWSYDWWYSKAGDDYRRTNLQPPQAEQQLTLTELRAFCGDIVVTRRSANQEGTLHEPDCDLYPAEPERPAAAG